MKLRFILLGIVFLLIASPVFSAYKGTVRSSAVLGKNYLAMQMKSAEDVSAGTLSKTVADLTSFPENSVLPIRVQAGVRIDEIYKIDESAKVFSGRVILRLKWQDARLRFNPWENGGDTLSFTDEEAKKKLETIWQPMIKFANIGNDPDSFVEKGSGLTIHRNGMVEYTQDFFGVFNVNFDLTAFPFDIQHLLISLVSQKYNLSRVILTTDQQDIDFSGVSQSVGLREWNFTAIHFEEVVFRGWERSLHSQLNIRWEAKRDSLTSVTTIFMPLFLILLTNYLVVIYLENEDLEKNITVIGNSLLAIIALDFTVSINYPALENNSMVNQTFMVSYISSWLLFLIAVTLRNPDVAKRIAGRYTISELVTFLRWGTPLLLVVVMTHIFAAALL